MDPSNIPVVDLGSLFTGDETTKHRIAREIDLAFQNVGFLVISGHGVNESTIQNCANSVKNYFDLPTKEKMVIKQPSIEVIRGYIPFNSGALATTEDDSVETAPDLKESFNIGPLKTISETDDTLKMLRSPNLWPEQPRDLRTHWEQCYKELEKLGSTILDACALALGLPARWFEQHTDGHFSLLSALHYPAQIESPKPGQLRAGAHTDFDVLTIISTDDAPGGLQIRSTSGSWTDVPWIPQTFVVNVGDLLARWSNDRWKSTLHRVVNPPRQLAQNSRRLTIGYFQQVNPHTVIEALPGTVSDDSPAKYPPITAGEHHNEKFLRQAKAASRLASDQEFDS